jgi:hypothetical protein
MSNRAKSAKRRRHRRSRRHSKSSRLSGQNFAPIVCGSAGCVVLLLAICHVCPYSIAMQLFRYSVLSGAAGWYLASRPQGLLLHEWAVVLGVVLRKIHG